MIRNAPFLGRGLGFPLRIDPATGGLRVNEGVKDGLSVMLEKFRDSVIVREPLNPAENHIAEAVSHILLTRPGEHDTLPEFGSRLFYVIFDPNTPMTAKKCEVWIEVATRRWEKRVNIPVPEGIQWHPTAQGIDTGQLPVVITPTFIGTQVPGNLVAPFVGPREARAQEYPIGEPDDAGHDWASRYHGMPVYHDGDTRFLRPRLAAPIQPAADDIFYETVYGDTWLLISHAIYGDIRFWWVIADCYVDDAAERGEPSDRIDTTTDPEPATLLRMPSRTRILMEVAR